VETIWRVPTSITKNVHTPQQQHGIDLQEVAGKDAVCLAVQELPPGRRVPPRRGPESGGGQDPADRLPSPTRYPGRAAHPGYVGTPSAGSPAPAAPPAPAPRSGPAAVPACSGTSTSSRPGAGARPAGSRGHDPVQLQAPRQQPGQDDEHGAVSPVRSRPRDLPTQDRDLMAQHQDLGVLDAVTARQQRQPAEHPDHEQIGEANEHERRA
jgi:hypothetical protein